MNQNRKGIQRADSPKMLAWYDDESLSQSLERYGLTKDNEIRDIAEVINHEKERDDGKRNNQTIIRAWRHIRDLRNDALKAQGAFVKAREERITTDPQTGERVKRILEARGIIPNADGTLPDLGFATRAPEDRDYVAQHNPPTESSPEIPEGSDPGPGSVAASGTPEAAAPEASDPSGEGSHQPHQELRPDNGDPSGQPSDGAPDGPTSGSGDIRKPG